MHACMYVFLHAICVSAWMGVLMCVHVVIFVYLFVRASEPLPLPQLPPAALVPSTPAHPPPPSSTTATTAAFFPSLDALFAGATPALPAASASGSTALLPIAPIAGSSTVSAPAHDDDNDSWASFDSGPKDTALDSVLSGLADAAGGSLSPIPGSDDDVDAHRGSATSWGKPPASGSGGVGNGSQPHGVLSASNGSVASGASSGSGRGSVTAGVLTASSSSSSFGSQVPAGVGKHDAPWDAFMPSLSAPQSTVLASSSSAADVLGLDELFTGSSSGAAKGKGAGVVVAAAGPNSPASDLNGALAVCVGTTAVLLCCG